MLETWGRVKGWLNAEGFWDEQLRTDVTGCASEKMGRVQLRLFARYTEHEYLSFKGSRAKLSMIISDLSGAILTETRRRLIHSATFITCRCLMPQKKKKKKKCTGTNKWQIYSRETNKQQKMFVWGGDHMTWQWHYNSTNLNNTKTKSISVTFLDYSSFFSIISLISRSQNVCRSSCVCCNQSVYVSAA